MIKGTYFSKFLKLFLFSCGICCIMGLGNSVNAIQSYGYTQVGLGFTENNTNTDFSNSVLKHGKLLTQYLGYTRPLFALDSKTLVFWNGNKLYLYDGASYNCGSRVVQGFIDKVYRCPEITTEGGDFELNDCDSEGISYNENLVGNFINDLVAGDWFYYYRYKEGELQYCRYFYYNTAYCFSSSKYHYSLCFAVANNYTNNTFNGLGNNLNLTGSTDFSSISDSLLGDPPLWGTSTPEFTSSTGVGCVSVSEILNGFDNKYTTGYCYAPVIESGVVTNYFIQDIFSSYSEFQDLYSNYGAYCHAPLTDEYCNTMLNNNIVGKSLISKIYNSNFDFNLKDLWNYCYYTTLSPNATTCTLQSGGVSEPLTHQELVDSISSQPSSLVKPGENTIVSNVLGTGATDYSDVNIIEKINGLYSRFTSFFIQQTGNNSGALPTYIISFLLVIILFKLFKK